MTTRKNADSVTIRNCSCRHAEGKLQISATIVNNSDRPCFVVPRVRRIEMNRETGVLSVWFSAAGRGEPRKGKLRTEVTAPKTEAIPERSEKTLTASLPADMTRLVPHDDGTFELESIDLTRAKTIEVHAAVGDQPFYFSPERKDYREQVAAWGRPLVARAKVEPPASAS
jgi:hypothetical protein